MKLQDSIKAIILDWVLQNEEDDGVFDDPEFMKTAVKECEILGYGPFRQRSC